MKEKWENHKKILISSEIERVGKSNDNLEVNSNEILDLWKGYKYDATTEELITPDGERHEAPILDAPWVQEWLKYMFEWVYKENQNKNI